MQTYRPPNQKERVLYFNDLKRSSSLAAWQRVFERHEKVVQLLASIHSGPGNIMGSGGRRYLEDRTLRDFESCHRAFEFAIKLLKAGNRSCFRWGESFGHFSEGMRMMRHMSDAHTRLFQGEGGIPVMLSPRWPELSQTLRECFSAYNYCGSILERSDAANRPARFAGPERELPGLENGSFALLAKQFADLEAPPVIGPDEPVLVVRSEKSVPVSGIWEPCVAPYRRTGFWDRFRRQRFLFKELKTNHEGCMNYLHEGAKAPRIDFPDNTFRVGGRRVSWYLLWEDQRYGSNPIPEEEGSYTYPATTDLAFPERRA